MKPDWEDAPEWAQWLAMDQNGNWFWYDREPSQDAYQWRACGNWAELASGLNSQDWRTTLEQRPVREEGK